MREYKTSYEQIRISRLMNHTKKYVDDEIFEEFVQPANALTEDTEANSLVVSDVLRRIWLKVIWYSKYHPYAVCDICDLCYAACMWASIEFGYNEKMLETMYNNLSLTDSKWYEASRAAMKDMKFLNDQYIDFQLEKE